MKRDMELARSILIEASKSMGDLNCQSFINDANDLQKVIYNVEIMKEAGLINANINKAMNGVYIDAYIKSLTWQGNDLLDAIVNDNVWAETKKKIFNKFKSVSFDIIKKVAEEIIIQALLGA